MAASHKAPALNPLMYYFTDAASNQHREGTAVNINMYIKAKKQEVAAAQEVNELCRMSPEEENCTC